MILRELSIEWLTLGGPHLVNGCWMQFCVHFNNNIWCYFNVNSIEKVQEYR